MLISGGDTIRVDDVTGLRGRVDSVTPGTVYLRLSAVSGRSRSSGTVRVNALVAVARQPDVLIQQRELAPGRTAALVVGSVVAIAALGVVVFLATFQPA